MTFDSVMLTCSVFAEAALLFVLMRRRVGRWLPWFFGYIAWTLVSDVASWPVMSLSSALYMRFYLWESATDCVLQFAVLLELAWSVLHGVHETLDRRNVWLVGAILFLAGMMFWPWAAAGVPQNMVAQSRLLMHLQITMSLLRIVFLVAIGVASQFLAIGWRNREMYVAAGLGFFSICSFAVALVHSHSSTYSPLLDRTLAVAYLGVLGYWIVQFGKEPARRSLR